jgi:hypothetical protein
MSENTSPKKGRKEYWSREVKNLLINWRQQININENEHLYRARRFKYIDNILTIFDLISNGSIFVILLSALPNKFLSNELLISITTIDAFIIINILITANYNFGVNTQKHFEAAREYNGLSKLIVSTLSLKNRKEKEDEFLGFVRKRFETIAENSISLPYNKKIHQLELKIYDDLDEARGRRNSLENNDNDTSENSSSEDKIPSKNETKFEQRLQTISEPDDYMKYQWNRFQLTE